MLVMPDADMEKTADALIGVAYGSAGERCMAISVALLVGDAADKLMPILKDRDEKLKVCNGLELDAEMGPIVTAAARDRIKGYIDAGVPKVRICWWTVATTPFPITKGDISSVALCSTMSPRT